MIQPSMAHKLIAQPGDHVVQRGMRPTALEDPLRILVVKWLPLVQRFGGSDFEGKRNRASAALLRLGAVGFVRQEEFQRRKEEAPEVAFVRVRAFEVFAFEQERKETL